MSILDVIASYIMGWREYHRVVNSDMLPAVPFLGLNGSYSVFPFKVNNMYTLFYIWILF